jgi:hypothetical protein
LLKISAYFGDLLAARSLPASGVRALPILSSFVLLSRCIAGRPGFGFQHLAALLLFGAAGTFGLPAADLVHSNFDQTTQTDNPWSGVNGSGLLSVITGHQLAVDDAGTINDKTPLGPSVAAGDLNGDGLPDLVIGDSSGFFWYFPNSGTPTEPKFTHGEIMPVWLGFAYGDPLYIDNDGVNNVVPKIQLLPLGDQAKVLDLVVGNYVGRLFVVPNGGSDKAPSFRMPNDRSSLVIATRKHGVLWTNYISPFFYDWFGTGKPDLIMGDGSYSANSIYLLKNQGDANRPIFNEDATTKIIPGMGREHLTPQVVDWNNDGKPDILAGERTGKINIFLNTSKDEAQPTFDEGHPIKIGSNETFGEFATATVCDLTGNKLPNLIVTNNAGAISYAANSGALGAPEFKTLVPIQGVNLFPKILRPVGWSLVSPSGVPHELLVTTNAAVQPDFVPPPNTAFKSALRFYVYPVKNTYFTKFYYPREEGVEPHIIICNQGFTMTQNTSYKVSFLIRTTGGIRDLGYTIRGFAHYADNSIEEVNMGRDVGSSDSWNQYEDTTHFRLNGSSDKDFKVGFGFNIHFHGQGEVYLDDVRVRPADEP